MTSLSKPSFPKEGADHTDRVQEWVVAQICPFFLGGASDNPTLATQAARQMLISYNAATGKELQLAAQVVVFGIAALDCLCCSMTERDMPVQLLLQIQGNAVRLNGMGEKSRKALEAKQRERQKGQAATAAAAQLDEAEFQAAIGKARQMVAFARTKLEAHRVSKALASDAPVAQPVPATPVLAPVAAEPMTLEVLARRNHAKQLWAKDLAQLTRSNRQIRH